MICRQFSIERAGSQSFGMTLPSIALAFLAATVIGCTEHGGGASVEARVSFVAADLDATTETASDDASPGEAATPGSFQGKVVLTGASPGLAPLIAQGADVKDKEVCAAVNVPDERLVLGDGNGVANVFIYLPKAPKGSAKKEPPTDPFLFDQKNCRFLPHAVVIPVGQTVKVLSDDSVAHNTHTYPAKNDAVNSGVAPGDREGKLSFAYRKAEAAPLSVKCDYHTWMTAWHLPVDHPYAAVTDANGSFSIADLPAGKHTFVVWHEAVDGNFVERKLVVDVKSGETTELQIDLPVAKLKL
jgi:plastocyanin